MVNHVALQAFTLGGTLSLAVSLTGLILAESLLRLVGVSEEVIAIGVTYMPSSSWAP